MTILDELPIKLTGMPPLNLTIRFLPADLKKLYPKRLLIKKTSNHTSRKEPYQLYSLKHYHKNITTKQDKFASKLLY